MNCMRKKKNGGMRQTDKNRPKKSRKRYEGDTAMNNDTKDGMAESLDGNRYDKLHQYTA